MSKYECEVFGLITYGPDLTYHELYELEERLMLQIQDILDSMAAAHINFWGAGDMLQFQCVFDAFDTARVRDFCDEAAALLHGDLKGRVLCLDRRLTAVHVFHLAPGRWIERSIDLLAPDGGDAPAA